VTLADKQRLLIEDLSPIHDPHDRLAAIVDRARQRRPLSADERVETHRVRGCVSHAWIIGELREGRCFFRCDADSPLVRGLLVLLCDFYSDAPPAEISATETTLLEELGLGRMLSATRLNGLQAAAATIRAFAAQAITNTPV